MNILVTGGAGYVGSACLRHLLQLGHKAIAYDNLAQGHPEAVPAGSFIEGDIADTTRLTQVLQEMDADAVMHFAAATCVGESVEHPEYHYANNVAGTLSLLNAMRAANVERMLFSSTCATYGDNPKPPMNEKTRQVPCSPYARTKLAVEWMISDFASAYGLGYTLLRYFNAAGASPDGMYGEDHNPENHLIPLVLQVPLGQRPLIKIFGDDYPTPDGTCIRDYVHVDDLARAHSLAIEATTPRTHEVFNVGTGNGQSVKQILRACEEVVGSEIAYEVTARRPGDPPALVADPSKLKKELGWKPRYEQIEDTIETAWKWHKSHPAGYGTT
ncbi:UDP-glucose 4-epimerase GalE [Aeoliella sp.]|uniref:UDP-glucose 4-epimerase GalE n=1 Tax=Aeoliella sp. TaxID=2795800 RepID=UPI003CCC0279